MAPILFLACSVLVMSPLGCASSACMQKGNLLYGCEAYRQKYQSICCTVPQSWAEQAGFQNTVNFFGQLEAKYGVPSEIVFYDSQCGLPIYVAPRGRTYADWKQESISHGWPSFRDKEVVHDNVKAHGGYNGELVSKCNTHLGHNLPDSKGRRDCVNLMCMAGVKGDGIIVNGTAEKGRQPMRGGSGLLPRSTGAASTSAASCRWVLLLGTASHLFWNFS